MNIVLRYLKILFAIFSFSFSFSSKWLPNFLWKQFTSGLSLLLYLSIQLRTQEIGLLNFQKFFSSFFPKTFFRTKRTLHLTHGTLRTKQIWYFFETLCQLLFQLIFFFLDIWNKVSCNLFIIEFVFWKADIFWIVIVQ